MLVQYNISRIPSSGISIGYYLYVSVEMSSRLDKSQTGRTQRLKQKAVATFYNANPATPVRNLDPSTLLLLQGGRRDILTYDLSGTHVYDAGCCPVTCDPPIITDVAPGVPIFTPNFPYPTGGSGTDTEPYYFDISWNPVEGATLYIVTSILADGSVSGPPVDIISVNGTTGTITTYNISADTRTFILTVQTNCGDATASIDVRLTMPL